MKKNPVSSKRLKDGTPAKAILDQEPSIEVSFDRHPDANPKSRAARLVRFQQNPERDWGPKSRPSKKDKAQTEHEKRQKFQGRRKRKAVSKQNYRYSRPSLSQLRLSLTTAYLEQKI